MMVSDLWSNTRQLDADLSSLFTDNNWLSECPTRRERVCLSAIAIIVICLAAKNAANWTGRPWPAKPAWAALLAPTLLYSINLYSHSGKGRKIYYLNWLLTTSYVRHNWELVSAVGKLFCCQTYQSIESTPLFNTNFRRFHIVRTIQLLRLRYWTTYNKNVISD